MSRHAKKRHREFALSFGPSAPAEVAWSGFDVAFHQTDEQGDLMSNDAAQDQPAERLAVQDFRGDKDSVVFRIAESINNLIEETEFSEALGTELTEANEKIAAQHARIEELEKALECSEAAQHARIEELEKELECSEAAHRLTAEVAHEAANAKDGPTVLRFGDGTSRVHIRRTFTDWGRAYKYALVIERGLEPTPTGAIESPPAKLGPGAYVFEFDSGDSAYVLSRELERLVDLLYTAEARR